MTPERRARLVKAAARELGFASCGITDLSDPPHRAALDRWLADGLAGTMAYMGRQAAKRREPRRIVPEATRVIVLTRPYGAGVEGPGAKGNATLLSERGRIARYARGRDYHETLARPLEALVTRVRALGSPTTIARWFVDAGPVPERELAQRAGLGWIGKNTMLIDPARGSYSFLASVFTDLELAEDPPFQADRCGSCRRCLDACPTDAFPFPRVLDARRCISYLTIEYRGTDLPEALTSDLSGWLFGCDICQEVCPWNVKFASMAEDAALDRDEALSSLPLPEMARIADREFDRRFGATALSRTGAAGLRRNARALRNPHSG